MPGHSRQRGHTITSNEKEAYAKAWALWGEKRQLFKLGEEAAELAVIALHTSDRGHGEYDGNLRKLAEEIVDVEMLIGQMKQQLDDPLTAFIAFYRREKLDRLERILKDGGKTKDQNGRLK